jgi:DNA-directed RNA polymerase subunit RPC12/RpoP
MEANYVYSCISCGELVIAGVGCQIMNFKELSLPCSRCGSSSLNQDQPSQETSKVPTSFRRKGNE